MECFWYNHMNDKQMLEYIEKHISFSTLQEEFRKIGVNFITAGIVGVFIYHYVGTNPLNMLWTSVSIIIMGGGALYFGVKKRG